MSKACPNCNAGIDPTAIAVELGLVHCEACGVVSALGDLVAVEEIPDDPEPTEDYEDDGLDGLDGLDGFDGFDGDTADVDAEPVALQASRRAEVPQPAGWLELDEAYVLPWYDASVLPLAVFTIVWDLFAVGMVLSSPGMVCMPHVWIGIGLAYLVAAMVLNRTLLDLRGDLLTVEIGPVPWWGSQEVPINQIAQLYVKDSGLRVNNKPRFHLMARLHGGRDVVVLRNLQDVDGGKWLEATLESRLGIENKRIAGEEA